MCTYEVEDKSTNGVQSVLKLLQHFFPYAQKQLGFHKPVMISFESDEENSNKLLGRTGHYNPDDFSIGIYVDGRHPKDVLRSLSHELIHHTQNCNGEFDAMENLGPGYAQDNPAMRDAELDAYKRGNIIFRDFEDLIKKGEIVCDIDFEELGEPRMSLKEWKNNELNMLLLKKWGLLKEDASISKAGRIDRTDIGNKAPPEWIKEGGMPVYRDEDDEEEGINEQGQDWASAPGQRLKGNPGLSDWTPAKSLRKAADAEQAVDVGADAMDKAITGTGPGTSVPPASAGRREDREHDDEEGNRPSMAKDMDLDEGDEIDEGWLQQKLGGWKPGRPTGTMPKNPAGPAHPHEKEPTTGTGSRRESGARKVFDHDSVTEDLEELTRWNELAGLDVREGEDPHLYGAMKRAAKRAGKRAVGVAGDVQQAVFGDAKPEKGVTGGTVTHGGSQRAPEGGDDDAEDDGQVSEIIATGDTSVKASPPPPPTPAPKLPPPPTPPTPPSTARRDDGKRATRESITIDEARDVARRIFEKLNKADEELSEGWLDRLMQRSHTGGRVTRGGKYGRRAQEFEASGDDPSQSASEAAADIEGGSLPASRRFTERPRGDVLPGSTPVYSGVHGGTTRERPQLPPRSESTRSNMDDLVNRIFEKLSKETK